MAWGQQFQAFHNLDIDQWDFAELGDEVVQELGQSKEWTGLKSVADQTPEMDDD